MSRVALALVALVAAVALVAGTVWALCIADTAFMTVASRGIGANLERALKPDNRPAKSTQVSDLRFVDGNGDPISLSDFRGRVVLLNVWATWCTPCRKEMPDLDRLQQALGGPGFEVVALSIDRGGVLAVEPFYEEMAIQSLHIYVDADAQALEALGALGIPLTLLIDQQGRELWRVSGVIDWDAPAVIERIRGEAARAAEASGAVR